MIFGIRTSIFRRILFSDLFTVLLGLGVVGLTMSFWVQDYIVHSKQDEMLRKAKRVNLSLQTLEAQDSRFKDLLVFLRPVLRYADLGIRYGRPDRGHFEQRRGVCREIGRCLHR
ncbi:hypothetical protein LJK88_31385 [Paenibacillus sp. P26]|nr:hypothetical protein LJK88_31385 [Paenibacillus sp. P26]